MTSVGASLATNNPDQIQDPVFGLLGDAAAAAGAGKITVSRTITHSFELQKLTHASQDLSCLQQATADQAFTNAKAAKDVAVSYHTLFSFT